jgi:transcriptional regulator with XRE-family HTH domain
MTSPLNWRDLVAEAVRRRKEENLTQAALAAIAGVSRATVVSLERGDTKLQLGKAFDILSALGLLEGVGPVDSQEAFVQAARTRWQQLIADLPDDDPARLPLGHVSWDYHFEVEPAPVPLRELPQLLRDVEPLTGWPPFWVPDKKSLRPYTRDGFLECWLGGAADRVFIDAGHSDFWRVSPEARAFLRRGYQEDGSDSLQPGSIFDLTLPIWRAGELLLHAAHVGRSLGVPETSSLWLRSAYQGLEGRELTHWAKPLQRGALSGSRRARTGALASTVITSPEEIAQDLAAVVLRLLQPLYDRFDGYHLPLDLAAEELEELRSARERRRGRVRR